MRTATACAIRPTHAPAAAPSSPSNSSQEQDTPPGDDTLAVNATLSLPQSPPLDPATHGLRLSVVAGGAVVLETAIPPGFDPSSGVGWRVRSGKWTYMGVKGAPGLEKAVVRSAGTTGELRVKLKDRLASVALPEGVPVRVALVLDASVPQTSQSVAHTFDVGECARRGRTARCTYH